MHLLVTAALLALADLTPTLNQSLDTPSSAAQTAAVLPFRGAPEVIGEDGLDLLSSVLASQLAELGGWKVISPEELRALLQNEASRQALGGAEDDALREASGALGAREVVTGEVVKLEKRLVWRASLLDQAVGEVVRRAEVSGPNLQALAARADEMALILLGRAEEANDEEAIAERLGFERASDVHDFQDYRDQHPEMGTQEALTRYVIINNIESNRLSLVEFGLFGGGAASALLAGMSAALAYLLIVALPLGPLAIVPWCAAGGFGLAGLGLMLSAVGVAIYDALNRGYRALSKKGCCRDDAEIHEASAQDSVRRGSALAIMLAGPVASTGAFFSLVLLGASFVTSTVLSVLLGFAIVPESYRLSPASTIPSIAMAPVYLCSVLAIPLPCLIGVPMGLLLLLVPEKSPVNGLEAE